MDHPTLLKFVSIAWALYSVKFNLSIFNLEWLFTDASHNLVQPIGLFFLFVVLGLLFSQEGLS